MSSSPKSTESPTTNGALTSDTNGTTTNTGIKPLTLYSNAKGPNPWKVAIILEELALPYSTKFLEMTDLKSPSFEKLNPNGRVPAIEDPNTGIVLWESGAIIEYLVEQYDKEGRLGYRDFVKRHQCRQWLYFQVSGQGPYFGQKAWFTFFHAEKPIRSAIDRYAAEIRRVLSVLDKHLKENGTGWLVGDKCTYADLSFVPWDMMLNMLMGEESARLKERFPDFARWHETMMARPPVAKIARDRQQVAKP